MAEREFPIYPVPRWSRFEDGCFRSQNSTITIWQDQAYPAAYNVLNKALSQLGLTICQSGNSDNADIAIGSASCSEINTHMTEQEQKELPKEGYTLSISQKRITICGADSTGILYGVSALRQLLKRKDSCLTAPVVTVKDWPYKPMRGVHIYMPSREKIPFFKSLLEYLALLRYNTLFLEVGGGMRYDRHPEVNQAWKQFCSEAWACPGGPEALQSSQSYPKDSTHTELAGGAWLEKEEVKDIISYANSYGIEVIPELQSLSHAYYMVLPHREIAERANDPWPDTYCPSNPRSYELYFELLDEVIEVFKPRMLHIGHDEIYTLGVCDRCRGKSGAELLAGDLIKIRDYLMSKGVRPVMWGDKLQNIIIGGQDHGGRARRSTWAFRQMDHVMRETYQSVDFVPKDILIMDWYWCLDPLSEQYFQEKGFEVIFGNFGDNYGTADFYKWDKRSAGDKVVGAEVSTWCDVSEYALSHNLAMFNFMFAANQLWWPRYHDRERAATLEAVASLQSDALAAISGVIPPSIKCTSTRPVNLSAVSNSTADEFTDANGNWTSIVSVPFTFAGQAITADVKNANSQNITMKTKADSIAFLHYCRTEKKSHPTYYIADPFGTDKECLLGYYLITYTDGSSIQVPLYLSDNISLPNLQFGEDTRSCPFWAQPAWTGRAINNSPLTLWFFEWVNPSPEKEIASLSLHYSGSDDGEAIVLAAVTLVNK